jgi:NAD(P)-dependent dehydrogenase (short-subunit alcohol dehydrogenase family)
MPSHYENKVAIVTGGASGIGRAVGEALLAHGAQVVLADINAELLDSVCGELKDKGQVSGKVVDVGDQAAVQALVDEVKNSHGRIDFMFNNAGIAVLGEVKDMEASQWDRLVRVNIQGVIYGVTAAYAVMREQGFGHIINTASVAGLIPSPGLSAYSMTKHAVVGLSESVRSEARAYGVKVTAVCPGLIGTSITENLDYLNIDKKKMLSELHAIFATPAHCAQVILRGVRKNQSLVLVTAMASILWWLYRLLPRMFAGFVGTFFMNRMRKKFIVTSQT